MAIVVLTPDIAAEGGVAATYVAPLTTNTYTIRNNGKTLLHVKKTGAGICTVTITAQGTVSGHTLSNGTVSIPATTGDKFIGPFPSAVYDDGNHDVTVAFSDVVGLTCAVIQLP